MTRCGHCDDMEFGTEKIWPCIEWERKESRLFEQDQLFALDVVCWGRLKNGDESKEFVECAADDTTRVTSV